MQLNIISCTVDDTNQLTKNERRKEMRLTDLFCVSLSRLVLHLKVSPNGIIMYSTFFCSNKWIKTLQTFLPSRQMAPCHHYCPLGSKEPHLLFSFFEADFIISFFFLFFYLIHYYIYRWSNFYQETGGVPLTVHFI